MNIEKLCSGIRLQQEIKTEILRYSQTEDFQKILPIADGLKNMETEAGARSALRQLSGQDKKQIKMLACMLACAADLYSWYEQKGISDTIYWDTMGCFTRFIEECRERTGEYAFDREWWTARQVSGRLFRIGELEYERKHIKAGRNSLQSSQSGACGNERKQTKDRPVISVHIPSDAVFDPVSCDKSIDRSRQFFAEYFPEWKKADYICNSWLLSPELKKLLPEGSHILNFQSRFQILKTDDSDREFIRWVFQTESSSISDFPENSTLQKNIKRHLLNGGTIGSGYGVLGR